MPRASKTLAVVVAGGVLLRVAAALVMGNSVEPLPGIFDQISYHTLAQRWLNGHGFTFAEPWWPLTGAGQPTAHWSYLYTLFLAAVYAAAGPLPLAARLAQAVLAGALHIVLTYRLARRVFGPASGAGRLVPLAAAAWAGVYGYFVYYGAALMTESFYIAGILWVLDCSLRLAERAPAGWLAWTELGLALAFTLLLRQVFMVCVPLLALWLTAAARGRGLGWRALARGWLAAGAVTALLIAPITLHNYQKFNRVVLLNTNAGFAFFWANHPIYEGRFVGILTQARYQDLVPAELRGLDEAALDQALLREGVAWVLANPAEYARLSLSRVPVYFMFWPSSESGLLSNVVRTLSFGVALPFMLAGCALWLAQAARAGLRAALLSPGALLLLTGLAYSVVHLLSWSLVRYRLPVDALGLVFAAAALVRLLNVLPLPVAVRRLAARQAEGLT